MLNVAVKTAAEFKLERFVIVEALAEEHSPCLSVEL